MTAQDFIVMLIFLVLTSVAHSCIIPFLSLYLKFVGLGIFEVGLIHGIKSWIAIIFIALYSSLGKRVLDRKWKRAFISGTLIISLTACTCLMYVPPHENPSDVTHCRSEMAFKQDTSTSMNFNTLEHNNGINKPAVSTGNTYSRNSSNVSEYEFQVKSFGKYMALNRSNVSTKSPGLFPKYSLKFKIPSVQTYNKLENDEYIKKDKQIRPKSAAEKLFTVNKKNTSLSQKNNLHTLFNSSFSGMNSAPHLKYFSDVESDNISFKHANKFNKSRHNFTKLSDERVTGTSKMVVDKSSIIVPYSGLPSNPFHSVNQNEGEKHILFNKHDRGNNRTLWNNDWKNISPQESHSHVLSPWSRVEKSNTNYIKPNRSSSIHSNIPQHSNRDDLNNSPIIDGNAWRKLSKILSVDSNHLINPIGSEKYPANTGNLLQQRTKALTNFQSQYLNRHIQSENEVRNRTFITQQMLHRVKKDNSAGLDSVTTSKETIKGRSLGKERNLLSLQKNSLKQQILPRQRTNPSSPSVQNGNSKITEFNPTLNKVTENISLNCTRSSEQIILRTLLSLKADNISQENTENKITFIAVIRKESGLLTDTFMTILVLVTFFEMFYSSLKPYCEIILRQQLADEEAYSDKLRESFTVWSLLTWGVVGCPILALLTVSLPCPYQLTHHLLLAAVLLFLTLVMALFILPIPSKKTIARCRKRKPSKPTPKDESSYLQRMCASLTAVVTGISTACYYEFVLWYIDSLQGFPYNYEFLYCGYYSVSALVEVFVFTRLHQSAKIKITGSSDSSTDESEEDVSSEKVIFSKKWQKGCELKTPCDPVMIGHLFLAIQLCALVFVESAWFLLLLAPLRGCCDGLLHATRSSHWHAIGYGMGCLFSGIAIDIFGMKTLFWTAAGIVFGWSSMNAVCFGLKSFVSCRPVRPYSHIPQSVEDDWLEVALQQEAQQSS